MRAKFIAAIRRLQYMPIYRDAILIIHYTSGKVKFSLNGIVLDLRG
ncbi:MAG: hypothetical protein JWM33_2183 [Caulobacteraceae bacterium]|nr:hypothetical protein [Caulobacteraceae bacterium]